MDNMFRFEVNKKAKKYDKHSVNFLVSLRIEDFQKQYEKYKSYIYRVRESDKMIRSKCARLKSLNAIRDYQSIEDILSEINFLLDPLETISKHLFSNSQNEFIQQIKNFREKIAVDALSNKLNPQTIYNYLAQIMDFLEEEVLRVIDMLEKVRQMENKPLKVLINFKPEGEAKYETHFTKYHVNLHHFSDILHNKLQEELSEQLLEKYYQIEDEYHQIAMRLERDYLVVQDFLKASINLGFIENQLNQFDPVFLKAHPFYDNILVPSKLLLSEKLAKVYHTYLEFYKKIETEYPKDKTMFLKFISLAGGLKLKTLFDLTWNEAKTMIENMKYHFVMDEYDLDILALIEPQAVEEIKKHIVNKMVFQHRYTQKSDREGFMAKAAEKGLMDNNQFYSHEIALYRFLNEEFKKNKFNVVAGVDIVFKEHKQYIFEGSFYSQIFKKEVKYFTYFIMDTYYTNLKGNFKELLLADSEEFDRKFGHLKREKERIQDIDYIKKIS